MALIFQTYGSHLCLGRGTYCTQCYSAIRQTLYTGYRHRPRLPVRTGSFPHRSG